MDLLDIATIRDVRTGQYAKKPKVQSLLAISFYINESLTMWFNKSFMFRCLSLKSENLITYVSPDVVYACELMNFHLTLRAGS